MARPPVGFAALTVLYICSHGQIRAVESHSNSLDIWIKAELIFNIDQRMLHVADKKPTQGNRNESHNHKEWYYEGMLVWHDVLFGDGDAQ
jgi:hypothetical protein